MPIDFRNLTVVSFESRRAKDMASLIERHGGKPVTAPTMREVPNADPAAAFAFADALFAGEIDDVLLLTGVGTTMLAEQVASKHELDAFKAALANVTTVARGPKPVAALRELGLKPTHIVPEPNTWQDLLDTLDANGPIAGKRIAVQEYGMTNDRLVAALEQREAKVTRVPVYSWALPEDLSPLRAAIDGLIAGEIDVAMFTSATQVYHLFQVAEQDGKRDALVDAFRRVLIASVGPVCTEALNDHDLVVDYEPDAPHMAPLVRETARRSEDLLAKKRVAAADGVDTNKWQRTDMVWSKTGEVGAGATGGSPASASRVGRAADDQAVIDDTTAKGQLSRAGTGGRAASGTRATTTSPTIADSVFMKACRREPTPYTPVWIMRQAGRYQREYRKLRKGVTLLELCHTPQLAAEVTLMAVDRLGVDAAIIFSDILPIVEPMGFKLEYLKGEGPVIHNPFRRREDLKRVSPGSADDLAYVYEAISITRKALRPDLALIGFCGAPFTIASYLIEGGKSKDYARTKTMMLRDDVSWRTLMETLTDLLAAYLCRQIEAGADAVQIFDSWAGSLSPDHYRLFVQPWVRRLIEQVKTKHETAPIINFATGNPALLPLMKEAGGDVIGLDWRVDLADAWQTLGDDVAVMGNLDPTVLYCSTAELRAQTQAILDKAADRPGHIFNLGHGVSPDMPPENVAELVDAVHELSAR